MDKKTRELLIVGTEVVVLGGVVVWFTRKNSQLEERIKHLEQKLQEHEKIMAQHHHLFEQIFGPRRTQPIEDQPPPNNQNPQKQPQPNTQPNIQSTQNPQNKPPQNQTKPKNGKQTKEEKEANDQLDNMLAKELEKAETPDTIDIPIANGTKKKKRQPNKK